MKIRSIIALFVLCSIGSFSCKKKKSTPNIKTGSSPGTIFENVSADYHGINFQNTITESDSLNYFTYQYIFLGGGVAVGDINNDGLEDLFFTGNMVSNKLYLNKGDLQFEDITDTAQISGDNRWYTGVTMVDINNDGYLDIYCSVSGKSGHRKNELYINQKDKTFLEQADKYGLADEGNSMQTTFFDYDNDGDLDAYIGNYPITRFNANTGEYYKLQKGVTELQSSHLYRNDGNYFTDVTNESGLKAYNLTLGVQAADINGDKLIDLYVSNDFSIPDRMYLNKGDGTFEDVIHKITKHTSFYGMGIDIGDFNNDLLPDIVQMDMDSPNNRRAKANMGSMDPKLAENLDKAGFHNQVMQNSLQLNTGYIRNGLPQFSEISRLAGVSSSDWSWGPLLIDLDNDGWKDLFITNGVRREMTNKDFFLGIANQNMKRSDLLPFSQKIPSEPIDNFVFRNKKDLTFEKANEYWGVKYKGFSNGAVYADLDNDGDLEIVTNNVNDAISLFKNKASEKNNYLTISFKGTKKNPFGIGVKVDITTAGLSQTQDLNLTRGYQSSVAPKLYFGLGNSEVIDTLRVQWPDGKEERMYDISVNRHLELSYKSSSKINEQILKTTKETLFVSVADTIIKYRHKENVYDDFKNELLLPHKTSNFGPGIATGDLNGDGLEDLYIGAGSTYPGGMFFQNAQGGFEQQKTKILVDDSVFEDLGALIFDPDNDGDNDLYIVSGGNEFSYSSSMLQDRLYVNDGQGNFTKSDNALPKMISSGSRVEPHDYDKDGDLDLFVGGRLVPSNYPYPADSYLLENISATGIPKFKNMTPKVAPDFKKLGLVTSAVWVDYDKDGWSDLILSGEWMPIKVFRNDEGVFEDVTEDVGLLDTTGWWFSLASGDFDKDGDLDFIGGNLGLNYKYKASKDGTFDINLNDFDGNKKNDIVLSYYNEGKKYPVRGRECSSQQVPLIKKKFKNYESFANATISEVYGTEKLQKGIHYQVQSFASAYFENRNGKFVRHDLPNEAQIAPINQILVNDFNNDGNLDALIAGNLYASEVETPRADGGIGLFLKGNGKGNFEPLSAYESGFFADGDVKDLDYILINGNRYILVAKNNDFLQLIHWVVNKSIN